MSTAPNNTAEVADWSTQDWGTQDWGIEPNAAADAQFKSDLAEIREAELAAERGAANLRVC